jgi:chromosome segregation ATPase
MIKDKERADMKITKLEEEVSSLKLENSNDKTTNLDEYDNEMIEGDNLDSSAQSEKADNLINQLHGEIASLKVELSNSETNQEEAIEKLEEKVATLNRQLGEERKNSKSLQENFDAEKAKSESLNTNLVVEQTNSKIHLANQLKEEKKFQAQLREEEKKYKVLQENFDAGLKNFKSVKSQLEVELSNSKTLKENLDFTLKNLGQVRAENSRQIEEERKKYKSLQENCNAQLVKSKDYASKLWRETQRDTTILREELEEERKKFNALQKNFDTEVLSDSKALTQNLTRQLGEEQKNLKVMKDSFHQKNLSIINLKHECNKHKVHTFRIFFPFHQLITFLIINISD